MRTSSACWRAVSLGCLAFELAAGAGGGQPSRVRILSRSATRRNAAGRTSGLVAGVVEGAAEGQADAAGDEGVADVSGVGDGAGEPVELGDDEGVPGADGGERLVQAGPGPCGAGEGLVEVDPVRRDAERGEDLALRGEVLQDGRAPGVADEFSHPGSVPFSLPSPDRFADYLYETALPLVGGLRTRVEGCLAGGSPIGHSPGGLFLASAAPRPLCRDEVPGITLDGVALVLWVERLSPGVIALESAKVCRCLIARRL